MQLMLFGWAVLLYEWHVQRYLLIQMLRIFVMPSVVASDVQLMCWSTAADRVQHI